MYRLGFMEQKWIPRKKLYIQTKQIKKTDIPKYEIADLTLQEMYDLGEGADISKYQNKVAKDSNDLIIGNTIKLVDTQYGDYVYIPKNTDLKYEQGGLIEKNNWGLNNLIYWWK